MGECLRGSQAHGTQSTSDDVSVCEWRPMKNSETFGIAWLAGRALLRPLPMSVIREKKRGRVSCVLRPLLEIVRKQETGGGWCEQRDAARDFAAGASEEASDQQPGSVRG